MITFSILRQRARYLATQTAQTPSTASRTNQIFLWRKIHTTSALFKDGKEIGSTSGNYEGFDLAAGMPVQGRGGRHFKRTLASFSLEGRVAVITGGARGLGLVMTKALVESGADAAIVDVNRRCDAKHFSCVSLMTLRI
jgi:hypothetical protein